jgi:RNA polymerase subunit RPABC4/transcription elongation factor Spt4
MPLSDTDAAASAFCDACRAVFYVTAEPAHCPYCGDTDVAAGYAVAIRPE